MQDDSTVSYALAWIRPYLLLDIVGTSSGLAQSHLSDN